MYETNDFACVPVVRKVSSISSVVHGENNVPSVFVTLVARSFKIPLFRVTTPHLFKACFLLYFSVIQLTKAYVAEMSCVIESMLRPVLKSLLQFLTLQYKLLFYAGRVFGGLLCYGALSTAYGQKHSDASVSTKALLMSAMLSTENWATEVRSCPWPQCDSASG